MEKRVLTVLRSGGDFWPEHVYAMQRQIARWAPDARFACLTDFHIPGVECLSLRHNWPGWWSKIEMFRFGGFLYTDLDNIVLGPIDDLFTGRYTTQRGGWNALAYVPVGMYELYYDFRHAPGEYMALHEADVPGKPYGDAGYIASKLPGLHWEDVVPGQVCNIAELRAPWPFRRTRPPPETKVLLCSRRYGRPWDLPEWRDLYAES